VSDIIFTTHRDAIERFFAGPVDNHLRSLAEMTATVARHEAPRGSDTNAVGEPVERKEPRLRDSIVVTPKAGGGYDIRATASYAAAVHNGRRPRVIVPKRVSVLRFAVAQGQKTGGAEVVFSKRSRQKAVKGNPFLVRALRQVVQ
jgi:hypothetical protein